jgi:biopolymer transport protein ExbD
MISFREKVPKNVPKISTASLPDIIFMLLFFFMITTTLKETSLLVSIKAPFATEVKKLEKKSQVTYIYVGIPQLKEKYGTLPQIQLNDAFQPVDNIREFVEKERQKMPEEIRNKMTVSLKADKNIEMGIITDIKQELRKASALKINYSAGMGSQQLVFSNVQ